MIDFEFSSNVITRVINELEDAEKFIRIAIFQIHNQDVFGLIKKKLGEGIRVEILTLPYDSINENIQPRVIGYLQELQDNNAQIHFCKWNIGDPERTTTAVGRWYSFHGKFIVTDKAAISLSANFTDQDELDAILIFRNDEDKINEYNEKFEYLLDLFIHPVLGSDGNIRTKILNSGYPNPDSLFELPRVIQSETHINHWIKDYPSELCSNEVALADRLYICPFEVRGRNIVLNLIENAGEFLYISTESFTDLDISNELIKAKLRGIDIKLLTGAKSMDYTDRVHNMLRNQIASGILVTTTEENLHAKLLITDNCVAVSSINLNRMNLGFSSSRLLWRENTETITLCFDDNLVSLAKTQFNSVFDNSVDMSIVLSSRIEREVGKLFTSYFGLRSRKEVKKLFSRYIISEEINVKKATLKIGEITKALMNSLDRTLIREEDFLMSLILHFLSDNKLKCNQLEEKLSVLNTSIDLNRLLLSLISDGYIEKEDDYYKLKVLSFF